jgi:hypothetical protein
MAAQLFHPCALFIQTMCVSWVHSKALTDATTPIHRAHNCNPPLFISYIILLLSDVHYTGRFAPDITDQIESFNTTPS